MRSRACSGIMTRLPRRMQRLFQQPREGGRANTQAQQRRHSTDHGGATACLKQPGEQSSHVAKSNPSIARICMRKLKP